MHVAVAGARGKMGRVAVEAFSSSKEFEYVGGFAREAEPAARVYASVDELLVERIPNVLLDFTTHPVSVEVAMKAVSYGVRPVIGASGWSDDERDALARLAGERGIGAMIVPNFSAGAVLMMRFAEEAARYFPSAEIVEMHRPEKKDKPSGTALQTATRMERAGGTRPPVHSVRLPGMVAHQEVLFGSAGEVLTIRHDSFGRESFVPGMFAAVRAVMHVRGLVIGLDTILDEMRRRSSST
ncbi:MAG TPA: dihydrodipicolinate reductase C-terminal domain-containing protein [Candidatus Tumulicola sp.]|nr:dihydrodipicolinate reductase C-terminal domain-containing protein [Candidatus Tumulicola sp.]